MILLPFLTFSSERDLFPIFFDSILSISHSHYGVTGDTHTQSRSVLRLAGQFHTLLYESFKNLFTLSCLLLRTQEASWHEVRTRFFHLCVKSLSFLKDGREQWLPFNPLEQLQTHENPFLTGGLEKTLGHINQNMAKMSSFLERMCGSGQQNLAASENLPPAKRPARKDLLSLPNHPKEVHPQWNKLTLMECFLSGTA